VMCSILSFSGGAVASGATTCAGVVEENIMAADVV
jgi:hypothetical protein